MKRYLVLSMLAVVGLTMLLSTFVTITAFAQDAPNSEEYMAQHDGGDRAAYLQPLFAPQKILELEYLLIQTIYFLSILTWQPFVLPSIAFSVHTVLYWL
jgi:hypothetical protein